MVPEEKPPAASAQSASPASKGPRRRSRRGGRRHSGRREPRSPGSPLPQSSTAPDASDQPAEHLDQDGPEGQPGESAVATDESSIPVESTGKKLPPLRPAPVVRARDQQRNREPQRESFPEREPGPKIPSITKAIEQVNEIIVELKHTLEEMDNVLETLELAERQKIDDEREIDNLQRALRRLNRPRDDDQRHH